MVATGPARFHRGEVLLADFASSRGSEIRKMRPCVVLSPDELNHFGAILIVAPLTTGAHPYRLRVACKFQDKSSHVVLDQIRAIDMQRVRRRLGVLQPAVIRQSLGLLREMFEE